MFTPLKQITILDTTIESWMEPITLADLEEMARTRDSKNGSEEDDDASAADLLAAQFDSGGDLLMRKFYQDEHRGGKTFTKENFRELSPRQMNWLQQQLLEWSGLDEVAERAMARFHDGDGETGSVQDVPDSGGVRPVAE